MVVLKSHDDGWDGGDEIWVVGGPLCGGHHELEALGEQLESPAPLWSAVGVVSNDDWVLVINALERGSYFFAPL